MAVPVQNTKTLAQEQASSVASRVVEVFCCHSETILTIFEGGWLWSLVVLFSIFGCIGGYLVAVGGGFGPFPAHCPNGALVDQYGGQIADDGVSFVNNPWPSELTAATDNGQEPLLGGSIDGMYTMPVAPAMADCGLCIIADVLASGLPWIDKAREFFVGAAKLQNLGPCGANVKLCKVRRYFRTFGMRARCMVEVEYLHERILCYTYRCRLGRWRWAVAHADRRPRRAGFAERELGAGTAEPCIVETPLHTAVCVSM